jgi:hypothetical protein
MLAEAATPVHHEITPKVEIRLVLLVGSAAQLDVLRLMPSAFPVRHFVMVLDTARLATAPSLLVDERATTRRLLRPPPQRHRPHPRHGFAPTSSAIIIRIEHARPGRQLRCDRRGRPLDEGAQRVFSAAAEFYQETPASFLRMHPAAHEHSARQLQHAARNVQLDRSARLASQ